jgi:hypothetical protein
MSLFPIQSEIVIPYDDELADFFEKLAEISLEIEPDDDLRVNSWEVSNYTCFDGPLTEDSACANLDLFALTVGEQPPPLCMACGRRSFLLDHELCRKCWKVFVAF